ATAAPPFSSLTAPPPTPLSTLSLHDALPIFPRRVAQQPGPQPVAPRWHAADGITAVGLGRAAEPRANHGDGDRRERCTTARGGRSEEHTSELQSRSDLVCRLLLEKKNNNN